MVGSLRISNAYVLTTSTYATPTEIALNVAGAVGGGYTIFYSVMAYVFVPLFRRLKFQSVKTDPELPLNDSTSDKANESQEYL